MKVILFFYWNFLGLFLVLSKAQRPYLGPFTTDCKMTEAGHEYVGPLNVTRSGRTCQQWNTDQPHSHSFRNSTLFPEGSADAAGNTCRNPEWTHNEGVWCYTTDPNKRWEECVVKFCGVGCKMTEAGHEYAGPLQVTKAGRTCQRWNSDQPHSNNFKTSTLYPEGNADAAGSKCRNPDRKHKAGVWCYTTDPNKRWEECNVKFCDCKLTKTGQEYSGPLNVTRSGLTCQPWNFIYQHTNSFKNSTFFPEGSAEGAGNTCRNPENHGDGVWCYTTDPNKSWEECDVKFCGVGCKLTKAGREYTGPLSVTRSGRVCQRWNSDYPHSNNFTSSTFFPDGSAEAAGNKCRNPDNDHNEGVWCYTTDPSKRWEECDVKLCGTDCRLSKAGHEYAGHLSVTRSGRTCQRWNSDKPHSHGFRNSTLFPEGSAQGAGNKCRNPDWKHNEGVWCYTTDPDERWEACDVKFCGVITTLSSELPQETPRSRNNESINIVTIVVPIVGVTVVICIVVSIIIWKRTGLFQSKGLNASRVERNQQMTMVTLDETRQTEDCCANTDHDLYEELTGIEDYDSAEYSTMTNSVGP